MSWLPASAPAGKAPSSVAVVAVADAADGEQNVQLLHVCTTPGGAPVSDNGSLSQWKRLLRVCLLIAVGTSLGFIRIRSSVFGNLFLQAQTHRGDRMHEQQMAARNPVPAQDYFAEYECVGWRETSTSGAKEPSVRGCSETIVASRSSGFCEIRHKVTREIKRVMQTQCDERTTSRLESSFKCEDFRTYLNVDRQAQEFVYDPEFSYGKCRQELIHGQNKVARMRYSSSRAIPFQRGIAFVGDFEGKHLENAYASIESLRGMGCALPIEFWYHPHETDLSILQDLARQHGVFLREIEDTAYCRGRYAKMYAAFYSAFDQVLLMGPESFATKDPSYLFASPEFTRTGAIFWSDDNSKPKEATSNLVQEMFSVQPVNARDQERGQLLIDRRRNFKALNVLMYYVVHRHQIESLHLVDGRTNLFQLAWVKTKSSFHMVRSLPDSVGLVSDDN